MKFTLTKLQNGLTIITVPKSNSPSVTVLITVKAGSKYESKEINGLSHFLEHMCFKGTEKRPTALQISSELDAIGAQNNAFTSQESTGYYAKAHPKYFSKILDIVSDIYLNSVFDEKEIEKEKGVIAEEISMYEDLPNRIVHDDFLSLLYGNQPAGWNIAGTKANVFAMKKEDFLNYRKKHYVAGGTTILVSGKFNEKKAIEEIKKTFANISTGKKTGKIKVVESQNSAAIKIRHKETDQMHLVLGVRTFKANDKRNFALYVLSTILGRGMSSRLFQKLRDEMGVGYYVSAGVDEFTDHGYLAVSAGVNQNRLNESVSAILFEMKRLVKEIVSPDELSKAKDFIIGHASLSLETSDAIAWDYAGQYLLNGKILTPEEFAEKIQKVKAKDVQAVAAEIMQNNKLNMAIVGNIKDTKSLKKLLKF